MFGFYLLGLFTTFRDHPRSLTEHNCQAEASGWTGVKSVVIHLNFSQQAFDWVDLGKQCEQGVGRGWWVERVGTLATSGIFRDFLLLFNMVSLLIEDQINKEFEPWGDLSHRALD